MLLKGATDLKILAIGDIVGTKAVSEISRYLSGLKREFGAQFTVINGENADMVGILPTQADAILQAGADVITLGNHTFGRQKIVPYLENEPSILRPYNIPGLTVGRGYGIFDTCGKRILVASLLGRCGMNFGPDSPFYAADKILGDNLGKYDIALFDFHAEATSEKIALAHYLDGRVSAVWGTHTHVQTADERVFPKGTGYITDLGMTGPHNSVIGASYETSLPTFLGHVPVSFAEAEGDTMINGVCLDVDSDGKCREVVRINRILKG